MYNQENLRDFEDFSFSSTTDSIHALHVDDDNAFVEMVKTFLERKREDVSVTTETAVEDGIETLRSETIDCVISDYEMPDQDGLDFLELVRDEYPDLPFILFTGKGDEEIASEAITAGVTEYLQKGTGTDQYTVLANRVENLVEKYRAEQEVFRGFQALESAQEGIGILNEQGEYVYLNQAYAEVYSADREEILEDHWESLYPEGEAERFHQEILPALETDGTWTGQSVGLTTDGERVVENLSLTQLGDGGHVCVVRDITDEKQREEELRREQQFLETALNSLDDLFYVFDEDLNYIRWNDQFEEVIGYSDAEIRELTPMDLFDGETKAEIEALIDQILSDGERVVVEADLLTKHGETIPYEFTGIPVEDNNDIIGVVGIGRRLT
ncbi:PAS domain-containing response regulator [Halorussus marinus]|uniref:PAS domain-containing response regulator n=1 Tax=Halorussus marinus TaxID=2505976 RepID=UPI00106EDA5F|nr:PAS domain-containing protein [Halorussus marinus]